MHLFFKFLKVHYRLSVLVIYTSCPGADGTNISLIKKELKVIYQINFIQISQQLQHCGQGFINKPTM
jgi:hypothetical protein